MFIPLSYLPSAAAIKSDIKTRPARWGAIFLAILIAVDFISILAWMKFAPEKIQKTSASSVAPVIVPSPSVGAVMDKLREAGSNPAIVSNKVLREPFSVPGSWITLQGDNVQAFEYSNPEVIAAEAKKFLETSEKGHIYLKDSVLLLYTGNRKDIVELLDKTFGVFSK